MKTNISSPTRRGAASGLGSVMLDVRGPALQADERTLLLHPAVGGVILFARNYHDPETLIALTSQLRALRTPPLLIATDHEGGPVQRFHQGFTRLPPARCFGRLYDKDEARALRLVEDMGWLLAAELLAVGVDFSFTPVLDLGTGVSAFLSERSYHRCPDAVSALAQGLIQGMRRAGMPAVGKHFPGHGNARGDSHHEAPVDERGYESMQRADLLPFARLIKNGLPAVMPAHVVYPAVDDSPAGFSPVWLQEILRGQLGFQGAIFSDDLNMGGAEVIGDRSQRVTAALQAGCDMVLLCNNQSAAAALLDVLQHTPGPTTRSRLARMYGGTPPLAYCELQNDARRARIGAEIARLDTELEPDDDAIPA